MPHQEGDNPSRTHVAALRIDGVWVAKTHSDVALIRCDRRSAGGIDLTRSITTLKIARAVVGEVTLAVGFARHLVTEEFNFARDYRVAQGTVQKVYDAGAGTNPLVNFPMFQTTGRYDSGMSGGPVFDRDGKCIGIVSQGLTTTEGDEQVGFASSIACLGELGVDLEMDDGSTKHFSVPELAGRLILLSEDGPEVKLVHGADGLHLEWPSAD